MKRGSAHDDDSYRCWKNNSPLLYDVLFNHNMVWPSLCVAWGDEIPVEGSETSSSSSSTSSSSNSSSTTPSSSSSSDSAASVSTSTYQSLYFSSRTDAVYNFDQHRWKGAPNFLLAATVELPRPRKSNYRGIGRFQEAYRSTHVNVMKRVVHPGEVNKIRLCPHSSDIIATHSDSKYTYVWNMATQPHRGAQGDLVASVPDLVLEGHEAMSEYALCWNKQTPRIVSGGSDHLVVMWDLNDHSTTLLKTKNHKTTTKWNHKKTLQPKQIFKGHSDTVEDVTFHPTDPAGNIVCSVGDDRCLIVWDARVSDLLVARVENAHKEDINCIDWNNHDPSSLVSGSSDGTIHQYDYRMLNASPNRAVVATYDQPGLGNITNIQWSPHDARYFASAGDDGAISVWDSHAVDKDSTLLFRHSGHRASIVDFDWNSKSPWTMVSMSDDSQNPRLGGGTMQVWRLSDLLFQSGADFEQKLVGALDKDKEFQQKLELEGGSNKKQRKA